MPGERARTGGGMCLSCCLLTARVEQDGVRYREGGGVCGWGLAGGRGRCTTGSDSELRRTRFLHEAHLDDLVIRVVAERKHACPLLLRPKRSWPE